MPLQGHEGEKGRQGGPPTSAKKKGKRKPLKKTFPLLSAQYGTNVFFEDEMREGTRSQCKELWTPKGHRPRCPLKPGYGFTYLYCALNPYEGRMFCLLLPDMTKESFTVFNQKFCQWLGKEHNTGQRVLLTADGAGAHQSSICEGCGIDLVKPPPASPELNPVERFLGGVETKDG